MDSQPNKGTQGPVVQLVDGHPVALRSFHDLSWLQGIGRVFRVFDQLTSGMLAFGVDTGRELLYLRYAGAPTVNYSGSQQSAIQRLQTILPSYQRVKHRALAAYRFARQTEHGLVCAFSWAEGIPLGPMPENYALFRRTPLVQRLQMVDALIDLHVQLEADGLVAQGLHDGHLLFDAAAPWMTLTSIDDYVSVPAMNHRGRSPGSPYYLAPECYQVAAALDETTTVWALGALAHGFFGDRSNPGRAAWEAAPSLYTVAARAMAPERNLRYQTSQAFQQAWREAVLHSNF